MKNILYLHGGAELYGADVILLQLIKGLDKKEFKPFVILPNNGPLVNELKAIGVVVEIYDYPILRRKYFNPFGLVNYISGYYKSRKYLKDFCIRNNIQIVHSNTAAVLEGVALKRSLSITHIWHLHEMLDKPKIVYKFLAYLISRNSDIVVTVSNAVKSHWLKSGRFKNDIFKVIHNGIDGNRFSPSNDVDYLKEEFKIKDSDIIVGMIGRVNAIKGQSVFIKAMEIVMEQEKNVKALLVGGVFEGQEWRFKELKDTVEKSKHSSRFIVEDFRRDTENLHCLLDIFVLPSIGYDSFPTVVLEAMASGKPVVAFKNGGVVEMIEDNYNGLFAEFGDENSLAEKILYLIRSKELREKMSCNTLERQKERFSYDSFINNFNNFYKELK